MSYPKLQQEEDEILAVAVAVDGQSDQKAHLNKPSCEYASSNLSIIESAVDSLGDATYTTSTLLPIRWSLQGHLYYPRY